MNEVNIDPIRSNVEGTRVVTTVRFISVQTSGNNESLQMSYDSVQGQILSGAWGCHPTRELALGSQNSRQVNLANSSKVCLGPQ